MYTQLCSWDNLLLAYRQAAKGKRGKGAVAAFEYRLEDNLVALREELMSRCYRPGGYTSFFIHEPKRRLISAAAFRDRVVHHALCNVVQPRFDRVQVCVRGWINHARFGNTVGLRSAVLGGCGFVRRRELEAQDEKD